MWDLLGALSSSIRAPPGKVRVRNSDVAESEDQVSGSEGWEKEPGREELEVEVLALGPLDSGGIRRNERSNTVI